MNSFQFLSTITAPYQPNFLNQLKQKCKIQPELDASVSKVNLMVSSAIHPMHFSANSAWDKELD